MKVREYTVSSTVIGSIILTHIGLTVMPSMMTMKLPFQVGIAHANTVSNENFQIEIEAVEEQPQEQLPQPIEETTTEDLRSSPGIAFVPSPFSFSITEPVIDFGILSATNPVIRTSTIQVISPGSGYHVLAFANHPLRSNKNVSIPDTTCDNGACSEVTAAVWENNLTYGFGYRCDANKLNLCIKGFEEKNAYKQLIDRSKKEILEPIIENQARTEGDEARITYKLNISGTQQKDVYRHTITFIAVPNF